MLRVYQLDPRHSHLLQDHWSGYIWIQPLKRSMKYKGRIMFVDDLAKVLDTSTKRQVNKRRLYPWFSNFKKIGYVFRNVDFIKLHQCNEPSVENMKHAIDLKADEVARQKSKSRLDNLRKRFGPDYEQKPKRVIKNPGSRLDQKLWLWAFENKELNLRFEHIYSFVEYGYIEKVVEGSDGSISIKQVFASVRVGKSRRAFTEYYGLQYGSLRKLASGLIHQHRGWTRIGDPRKISRQEAQLMKVQLENKREVLNDK